MNKGLYIRIPVRMLLLEVLPVDVPARVGQPAEAAADLQVAMAALHVLDHVVLLLLEVGALGAMPYSPPTGHRHLAHHTMD